MPEREPSGRGDVCPEDVSSEAPGWPHAGRCLRQVNSCGLRAADSGCHRAVRMPHACIWDKVVE